VWHQFGTGVLAQGSGIGLSIWEARTNSLRNNTMTGAVAGSPGTLPTNWTVSGFVGLTQTIVGTGTNNGIGYIDIQFSGTTGGTTGAINFESATQIAAANTQIWALSSFLALVGGSFTNVTAIKYSVLENTAGGALVQGDLSSDVSSG